ncbi:MAG: glycerophosphodiester phosphodiesterase [Oligoflexia bacterium]|nr:glycerophosphodiester phosphodiesterase [Oligoflexia bacterium]
MKLRSSSLLQTPFAHRGLHHNPDCPENSLAAFEKTVEAGYGIELDLRVAKDGGIVVFHDRTLSRCCGVDALVRDRTAEELQSLRLFDGPARIPTFKEVLDLVSGRVPLLIEIKREQGSAAYEDRVLGELRDYRGAFAIQSFNPFSIAWFKREAPEVPCGLLSGRFEGSPLAWPKRLALKYLLPVPFVCPDFISYELEGMPMAYLAMARKVTGLPLLFWTIRSDEALRRARALGGNVIFENVRPG